MNRAIIGGAFALLTLATGFEAFSAAVFVTRQTPPSHTNQTVSTLGLSLSGPVVGSDARAAATYTLLDTGIDRLPGTADDRAVQLAPSYADGSNEIKLTIIGTNTLDLRSWRELDYEDGASGTWTVDANGQSVFQTVNANLPTFFVSDADFIGRQFIGRMRVENDPDDDFIGLVFGFQTNLSNGKPDSYYYLSWKKLNQVATGSTNYGEAGFKLLRITNSAGLSVADVRNLMWDGENGTNIQVLARLDGTNTLGWLLNTDYDFTAFYETSGAIAVSIRETTTGLVRWEANVTDPSPLGGGRIGFLNHSQRNVRYSGLAQSDALPEGVYQLTARAGNPGLRGLDGTPLDGNGDGISGDNYVSRVVIDLTSPRVNSAALQPGAIRVTYFDAGGMDPATVNNPAAYALRSSGGDGSFGEGNELNLSARISSIAYDPGSSTATLVLAPPLADEFYQLTVPASAPLRDLAANSLQSAFQTNFLIDTIGPKISSIAPSGFIDSMVDHVDVIFDSTIQAATFTPSDAAVVGPAGSIPISELRALATNVFRLTFVGQGLSGTYTVSIGPEVADPAGNPMNQDGDTTNGELPDDRFTGQFVIRLPDLAVSDISAPPSALAGQPIQVSWVITNRGLARANGPRVDTIYLSPDASAGGDQLLVAIPQPDPVEPGQTQARSVTLIVPAELSGTRFIVVGTDSANQVNEGTAESNNVSVDNQALQILASDLTVVATTTPAAAQLGQTITASWTVQNTGTAPALASWNDRLYLSASSNSLAGASLLGSYPSAGTLAAGSISTQTQSVTLPLNLGLAAGNYFIVVVADASQTQPESNESNNTRLSPLALTLPPLPDLIVTDIRGLASALPGQVVPVSWTITNRGAAIAVGPWMEVVLLSADNLIGSDQLLASFSTSNTLAAGAFVSRTQNVSIPVTGASGDVRWAVVVDPALVLTEEIETNNAALSSQSIQIPAALTLSAGITEIAEQAATPVVAAEVFRNGSVASALLVSIASSNTNELTAPAAVTIPGGQVSARFELVVRRDGVVDGDQMVTISATAAGLAPAGLPILVRDSDVPRLFVTLPATVREGSNVLGTVRRERVTGQDMAVELQCSSSAQLTAPAGVIIPANQADVSFSVIAVDDTLIESTLNYTVTASAPGHRAGSAAIAVIDDDAVALTVRIEPREISEGAGALAALGTVLISGASPRPLVIALESTATNAARVPSSVTIAPGALSATFPIAAVDDDAVDGAQPATIRAFMTETVTGTRLGPGASDTLTVLDDDGPALRLVIARDLVAEGLSPATTAVVSRNTPTNVALVVSLRSSDITEATVPASITIPIGARSQEFEIVSVNDGLTDSNQLVIITAEAAGFTRSSDTLIVSDVDLPDLVVANVTAAAAGRTDEPFNVSFRIENRGLATATGRLLQRVWLSSDAVIGDDTLLGQAEFNGSIPAGLFFAQTLPFRLPRAPGTYWVIVTTDAAEAVQEGLEDNNSAISATGLQVEKSYYATVAADVEVAPAGTAVPLHGQAFQTGGGNSAPFELVNIHIGVRGTRRIISALTGQDGRFAATFRPLPGEAGLYSIGADHPGVPETPAQDQFTLLGLRVVLPATPVRVAEGSSVSGELRVENLSDVALTGLAVAVVDQPGNLQVTASLSANTLPGLGEATLGFALTAVDASLPGGIVHLRVTSAEGGRGDAELPVTVEAMRPRLAVTPASLVAGMKRGRQTSVQCQVTNLGGAATGELELLLPPVPWLTPASGARVPSLGPGAGTTISLLLTPPADLTLGAHQGSFTIAGSNVNVTVPFNFRALSEAVGELRIAAVDEYTYYAEGAPKVTNAAVTIFDATTGETVGGGVTDGGGQFGATNLPEAYYRVEVRAEGHGDFRATVLVAAGGTNELLAFLPRQTVQYFWTVVPTEIEDRTKITIETVFETVVPIPVVTIEPNVIDLEQIQGAVAQIDLKITNHGLIAANELRLNFGTHPNWQLTPLIRDIGVLAPRSSLTVPLVIRRLGTGGAAAGPFRAASAGSPCFLAAWGEWKLVCGPIVRSYTVPILVLNPGGTCPAAGGGAWFPHGGGPGGSGTYIPPSSVSRPTPCDPCLFRLGEEIFKCSLKFILPDGAKCIKDLYGCASGTPSFGTAYTCFKAWYNCSKAVGEKVPPLGFLKYLECAYGLLTACEGLPSAGSGQAPSTGSGQALFHAASLGVTHPELEPLRQQAARLQKLVDVELLMFGGEAAWFQDDTGPTAANWLGAFAVRIELASEDGPGVSSSERAELLNLTLPQTVTAAHVNRFVDRWNRSVVYWQAGIFNQADVPAGQSPDFLALDVMRAALAEANAAMAAIEAEGFSDIIEGVEDAKRQLQQFIAQSDTGGGVCARVRLRIEQEAVLTRDAFEDRLEIVNSTAGPLDLVQVDLEVRDPAGAIVTSLFGIRSPGLSGLSGVDGAGVIGPNSTGRASWILIPTPEAAPLEPAEYRVSGRLRYRQGGVLITIPLAPESITVHPSASLTVKYFHQRDVFSDDPFTELIEPSLPFTLGVMIQNSGRGAARNVRITSAQPQIIENEKGLLIDLEIIATEVEGQNLTPSLTANFGDINPGELASGRWLLRSSLQGLFIDYRATFEHLDGLGDQRLSLIDQVTIHELIHPVRADGAFDDGRLDFLVNDVPDLRDLPDTLHLSDGREEPVNVVTNALSDGPPTGGDLRVALSANMPAGWTYLRVPEPGNGQFRLARVLRPDGTEVRLSDNAWTTDRTFLGSGRRPIRENILHLLDYNSAGAYTLVYEELSPTDHTAPASTISPVPANSYAAIPLSWAGADESGGSGLAFFDVYVSGDGGPFLPWLQRTTLTGTAYVGEAGHSYAFYSVATDRAGNRETPPAVPDTQTSVTLSNRPPTLVAGGPVAVVEGQIAVVTNLAADPDLPANQLTFSLGAGAPAGCVIDPGSGRMTWATGEANGPGTNILTVVVRDNGFPALSATGAVTIIVTEANVAPMLESIASRTIKEGFLLMLTNRVSDTDLPAQSLTFALAAGAPAGAAIHPGSGIFTWKPSEFQGPSTNVISVIVTDVPGSTAASLSATQQFTVIVRDTLDDFVLASGTTNLLSGESGSVPFQLLSGATLTNIVFLLEASAEQLTNLTVQPLAPELASASLQHLGEDRYLVLLQTRAGQPVQGSLDLASLHFDTLLDDHSQIVRLGISAVEGTRETGVRLGNGAGRDGRVFVVANEPLLHAVPTSNELQRLILYGRPGGRYGIVSGTNVAETTLWTFLPDVEIIGPAGSVEVVSPLHPVALYRAVELPISGASGRKPGPR